MKFRALALGALLFEAFPASAQVRVAASAAEAGASAAAAAAAPAAIPASTLPLLYELRINSPAPTLSAGSAFLKDTAAQRWFLDNRPAKLPALIRNSLDLRDWEELLTTYEDSRLLREAILSRKESAFIKDPASLLKVVDRTSALAAKRRLYEEAVLDWSVIGPKAREILTKGRASEKIWSSLPLSSRYETMRLVLEELARNLITVGPGHPDYAAQYETAFRRVGPVMKDEELDEHREHIARVKRLDESLRLASNAAGASADAIAATLLERARNAGGLDVVQTALRLASQRLGLAAPSTKISPAYDLPPEETRALETRLFPAIQGLIRGTPSGDELLAAVSGTGLRASIDTTFHEHALGHYDSRSKGIVLGAKQLAQMMAELGRTPRDLLTDDEALAEAAVIYSHLFVHEATHHRQELWGAQNLPPQVTPFLYNQRAEVEANNAQAKFLKEKRSVDPDFAARDARLRKIPGLVGSFMRHPERAASDPNAMSSWLTSGYRSVPSLARSSARIIDLGINADRRYARYALLIDVELAARRRRPLIERLELEREGSIDADHRIGGSDLKKIATSRLRRMRASMRGQTQTVIKAALALTDRFREKTVSGLQIR